MATLKKKIVVLIEKGSDGYYSCYSKEDIPHFALSGFGDTAKKAKSDFMATYQDMCELEKEEGRDAPEFSFVFKYDMASFFSYFSMLNISKVAEIAGINASLLRRYASGKEAAGETHYARMRDAVSRISAELSQASF